MQNAFSGSGLGLEWELPLTVGGVNADQVQGLYEDLIRASTTPPALTGALAPAASALIVTSPLITELPVFLATQAEVETVLLLLFVSLIVIGATVILLAARMVVARRDGELAMLRARGGSLRQVAAAGGGGDGARQPGRGAAGRADRRRPGRRRGPRPGGVLGARLVADRDRGRGRIGRAAADRGVAVPQARPGRQPGPDHHDRDQAAQDGVAATRRPAGRVMRRGYASRLRNR